jgi:hypothetical protein
MYNIKIVIFGINLEGFLFSKHGMKKISILVELKFFVSLKNYLNSQKYFGIQLQHFHIFDNIMNIHNYNIFLHS